MRRFELVCGSGWAAVTFATLAFPLVGVIALVFALALFVMTLVLACVVVLLEPDWRGADHRAADASPDWSSLGPAERARLVRIINLSRVATNRLGARLLLSELDNALEEQPLASWAPLSELRTVMQSTRAQLAPFESEPCEREGPYLFVGRVP
jgi:hypothetical protein